MKNVWYEYKNMKYNFPLGSRVRLKLQPIEDYFEMIWAADAEGVVVGYNILDSFVIVDFDNGNTMQCGQKLLSLIDILGNFDI